jgi:hypothetical protein
LKKSVPGDESCCSAAHKAAKMVMGNRSMEKPPAGAKKGLPERLALGCKEAAAAREQGIPFGKI